MVLWASWNRENPYTLFYVTVHSPGSPTRQVFTLSAHSNQSESRLFVNPEPVQWPIVYRPEYNIKCFGLQHCHPFDSQKWGRIFKMLKKKGLVSESSIISPVEASKEDLLQVHSREYLNSLKTSIAVARVLEVMILVILPHCIIDRKVLRPMRFQVGGSVAAARVALDRGWAINIGGGFHHASRRAGGGFCAFADITLMTTILLKLDSRVNTVMIVDLDAHQGNGHERDLGNNSAVFIMDVFNAAIYPRDTAAKRGIRCIVKLAPYTEDNEYLELVERNLEKSLRQFQADLIIYNAGTDILAGDRLGRLSISAPGVIRRDELVFMKARERRIPIVMLTSGGYQRETADIVAKSILNLHDLGLISGPDVDRREAAASQRDMCFPIARRLTVELFTCPKRESEQRRTL